MVEVFDLFRRAGISKWPLGLCAILSVGIIIERILHGARHLEWMEP